jgi:DNA polymerase III epsilon subunit-like protein
MYRSRTLFDLRAIHGDRALWRRLDAEVNAAIDTNFLQVIANDCLATLPPVTFFQDAVVDKTGEQIAVFHLEETALRPLVDVGRVFGLAGRSVLGQSTVARFATARSLLPEQQTMFAEAADTLRVVLWQQGRIGISQGTSAIDLPPALLSRHDRHLLKSGFRSIPPAAAVHGEPGVGSRACEGPWPGRLDPRGRARVHPPLSGCHGCRLEARHSPRPGAVRRPRLGDDGPRSAYGPNRHDRGRRGSGRRDPSRRHVRRAVGTQSQHVGRHGPRHYAGRKRRGLQEPDALARFLDYLGTGVIVGHHILHDVQTLDAGYQRHWGFTLRNHHLDTMDLTRHLERDGALAGYPPIRHFTLDSLCEMFGVVPHDRHTASGDAFITAQVFLRLLRLAATHGRHTLASVAEEFVDSYLIRSSIARTHGDAANRPTGRWSLQNDPHASDRYSRAHRRDRARVPQPRRRRAQQPHQPQLNQPGKDVQWVPTPPALAEKMLDMARLTPDDRLVDLGSGDGVLVMRGPPRYPGARHRVRPRLVDYAKRSAREAGLDKRPASCAATSSRPISPTPRSSPPSCCRR